MTEKFKPTESLHKGDLHASIEWDREMGQAVHVEFICNELWLTVPEARTLVEWLSRALPEKPV